jgi:hypothetical protein
VTQLAIGGYLQLRGLAGAVIAVFDLELGHSHAEIRPLVDAEGLGTNAASLTQDPERSGINELPFI